MQNGRHLHRLYIRKVLTCGAYPQPTSSLNPEISLQHLKVCHTCSMDAYACYFDFVVTCFCRCARNMLCSPMHSHCVSLTHSLTLSFTCHVIGILQHASHYRSIGPRSTCFTASVSITYLLPTSVRLSAYPSVCKCIHIICRSFCP